MALYTEDMHQTATYWPPGTNDFDGGQDYSAVMPITISCRWEDKAILFRDATGREVVSDAIVYVGGEVVIGGHLALGDVGAILGDHPHDFDAKEIRSLVRSPDLDTDEELLKVIL